MAPVWAAEARKRQIRERVQRNSERMTPEEHARAVAHWEREKVEVFGKVRLTREDEIARAEARLSDFARHIGTPVAISDRLAARLVRIREEAASARPDGSCPP
jgi:hypothetical protein